MEYLLMTNAHVAQVAELEKQCFSTPWSLASVTAELTNPLSVWVVAVEGDIVTGYVGSQSVCGEADMMNLAVMPEYRCRGIGKDLVHALIQRLQQKDVHCLTLEVRASNVAAIGLYTSLGFLQVGRRPNYYTAPKEDALILRKEWTV